MLPPYLRGEIGAAGLVGPRDSDAIAHQRTDIAQGLCERQVACRVDDTLMEREVGVDTVAPAAYVGVDRLQCGADSANVLRCGAGCGERRRLALHRLAHLNDLENGCLRALRVDRKIQRLHARREHENSRTLSRLDQAGVA